MKAPCARPDGAAPRLWGHRGTRIGAPENTLLAFQHAIDQGADGVELDVRLCAGGEVVVIHDTDLARVAGRHVSVRVLDADALAAIDLGQGQGVPRLCQACEQVLGAGLLLNVEIKADGEDLPALVDAVVAVLGRLSEAQRGRVVVSSFSATVLQRAASRISPARLARLLSRTPRRTLACDGIHPRHDLASVEAVARWQADGKFVNVWTVNDPAHVPALLEAGVDGIITDDIPTIRAAVAPV